MQGRKPRAAMSSAKAKQALHKQLAPWLSQCLRAHSERPDVGNGYQADGLQPKCGGMPVRKQVLSQSRKGKSLEERGALPGWTVCHLAHISASRWVKETLSVGQRQ